MPSSKTTTTEPKSSVLDYFREVPAPFVPLYWHVLVQVPQQPDMTDGGIALPDEYRDSAEFASYVGRIAAVGQFAFQAKTKAEIDLKTMRRVPVVGDWVIFGKHAGEKFRTRDNTLWILMADTEVRGIIDNPDQFECMKL